MAKLISYSEIIEVDDARWISVRKPNPGDKLLLRQRADHLDWVYEPVTFLGERDHPDEVGSPLRQFRSIGGDGLPYEWEAYRYNGRWCLGSSADPFSLGRMMTDAEVRRGQIKKRREDLLKQINLHHLKLERIKAEIAEMETRRADLAIELTELKED